MTEPLGIGGVQSDLLTLSEDLTKRGHEVHVAAMPGVLLDEIKAKGARHVEIDFHFRGIFAFVKAVRLLRRCVREQEIELVAPQSVRSTVVAYFALRLLPFGYRVRATARRVPIVTTIHNIHNPIHFRYAGAILERCADYVIFESHYERNRLLKSGLDEAKSTVIHSGIDTDRFVPGLRADSLEKRYGLDKETHFVFGIVARLSEEKGHRYLVEAFGRVVGRMPNARLMIVGDGPLLDETVRQVESLALTGTVIFTGLQRNIPEYLALFDTFVLSSTRESFPLAAREAMAAGKAVIAPRIGGCPEVVDDGVTGYLFESANVGQLADCMLRLAENGQHLQYGRAARERVERLFSRRSWVDGDEDAYLRWLAK
jgi:glycosyltransferase involved in cell wall biosynthesis